MSIAFKTQELQEELRVFARIAESFLEPGESDRLINLAEDLRWMRHRNVVHKWGISENEPLRTRCSEGAYQEDDEGHFRVAAHVATTWAIRPVSGGRQMVIDGNVSTTITLMHEHQERLGLWRMDVGHTDGPGCAFHVQIEGKSDQLPFPEKLDVPRLPTLVPTLGSILEFVLFELFHQQWLAEVVRDKDPGKWLDLQRDLWLRHLEWQMARARAAEFSPWASIRQSHPDGVFG
jgi:hypothetical protein